MKKNKNNNLINFKSKKLQLKKSNQSKFIKNTLFKVPTPNGFQNFKGFLKSKDKQGLRIDFDDNTFISCTKTHLIKISENLFIEAQYLKINDIISNKKIIKISNQKNVFYDLFEVQGHQYIVNDIIHHNCNYLIVDECVSYNEIIEIKNKTTGQIRKIKIGEFEEEIRLKEKIFDNLIKLNPSNIEKVVEYINFVIDNKTIKEKYKTDEHHILPKNKDCFPEYINEKWNKISLTYKNHFIAHKLLYEAYPNNKRIVFAFYAMLNKIPKFKGYKENYNIVTPDEYQALKEKSVAYLREINSGFVMAVKNGKTVRITKEEFDNNRELYQTPSDNLFNVIDIKSNQKIRISKDDYDPKIHRIHTKGVATYLNLKTLKKERIDISERKDYHLYNNQLITIKRNNEIIEGIFVRDCNFETDIFICKYYKKRIRNRKRTTK
jgi:homing endonuclease|nr:MAG TPA: HNH endonuclease [Caudoviricetes sp.]